MKYGFGLPLFASSFIDRLNQQEHSPWGSALDFRSDRLRETTQALCVLQLARESQNLPTAAQAQSWMGTGLRRLRIRSIVRHQLRPMDLASNSIRVGVVPQVMIVSQAL